MSNAGNSSDAILFDKKIKGDILVLYVKGESCHQRTLKHMMNDVLFTDEVKLGPSYNGKSYHYHTAWCKKSRLLIKMNQYRLHNWYFLPLKEDIDPGRG